MPELTISLPKELLDKMEKFHDIQWSEVARLAFEERVNDLEQSELIVSNSFLSEEDAKLIAQSVDKSVRKNRG